MFKVSLNKDRTLFRIGNSGNKKLFSVDEVGPDIRKGFLKLKKDFGEFEGTDQWEVNDQCKNDFISLASGRIDKKTQNEIANGFSYNKHRVKLSLDDQMYYKNTYEIVDILMFPIEIRTLDGYLEFSNKEEYIAFYSFMVSHIRKQTKAAWKLKDELEKKSAEDLYKLIKD